jgi:quercetin dioxygenase-like cupin family protein
MVRFAAPALLATMVIPSAADPSELMISKGALDLSTPVPLLPDDHPVGHGAIVTLVSLKRPTNLHNPAISTFIVDYPPGASAMLHRTPTSGYVLVHVLAGTIRAFAWRAGVGTYRAGQTWSEPALANDIATANGSTRESARVLVVLITGAQDQKTVTVTE